ncbi:MAG: DUF1330 domain-containing protein [Acidobacteriota bacterium]
MIPSSTAASGAAPDGPVYMLNVLWFAADDGRATYSRYASAAMPLLHRAGARVVEMLVPVADVIGEFGADAVFVVEWPSWEVFERTVGSAEYQDIAKLRERALERSLLVRCARPPAGPLFGALDAGASAAAGSDAADSD